MSPTDLDQQIGHDGATWLDRELVSRQRIASLAETGFGQEVNAALRAAQAGAREMGHAKRLEGRPCPCAQGLIQRLEAPEDRTRRQRAWPPNADCNGSPPGPANIVTGRLVGFAHLASGRFAMIEDGLGFQLVPWQPVLEKRIGQHISGIAMRR